MIVADTNLIAALAVKTDASKLAFAVLTKDSEWMAPQIWESEFRNVLIGMVRAGRIEMKAASAAFALATESVETFAVSTGAVLRLAEEYGLSAYDAEFAALAEWLDCRIVSFDEDLLKPGLAVHPKDF
ncbi:MAG: type II toxin-antitoxin system VapC family toxin [Verrucomicrobiota bacterium]|nr:type II toxin-antitoxin system VapC family toxin [Verrucomicrobiota bacterium]